MGPEPGADAPDLATLVETRLGREVLDRLVDPVAGGVHSVHPSRLAVDVVSPGLHEALAEEGSLVRAAASLRAKAPAGPVVASTAGGLFRLVDALVGAIGDGGRPSRPGAWSRRSRRSTTAGSSPTTPPAALRPGRPASPTGNEQVHTHARHRPRRACRPRPPPPTRAARHRRLGTAPRRRSRPGLHRAGQARAGRRPARLRAAGHAGRPPK